MASNLMAMASNLEAMVSNLEAMASNLMAMASNLSKVRLLWDWKTVREMKGDLKGCLFFKLARVLGELRTRQNSELQVMPLVKNFSNSPEIAAYIRELTDADPWDDSRARHEHKLSALEGRRTRGSRAAAGAAQAATPSRAGRKPKTKMEPKKKGRRQGVLLFFPLFEKTFLGRRWVLGEVDGSYTSE